MKALVIRSPWIDLILSGSKTWELRTKPTSIRGRVALIKAGSGLIYGTAELVECLPALSPERLRQTQDFHGIAEAQLDNAIQNRWTTPWVLRNVVPLETPKRYVHPSGAVTWVTLPDELLASHPTEQQFMAPNKVMPIQQPPRQPVAKASPVKHNLAKEWTDIQLTDGNIRNGHFYLRMVERLLPGDCIGGSNKAQAARTISVQFEPGMLVETDIAGDKMILRSARGQIRDFFERTQAKAGDSVRFGRIDHHGFIVTLQRSNATAP